VLTRILRDVGKPHRPLPGFRGRTSAASSPRGSTRRRLRHVHNHRNATTSVCLVTTDFGKSFRSIVNDLPPMRRCRTMHVIRRFANRDLLFVGTDVGAYSRSIAASRGRNHERCRVPGARPAHSSADRDLIGRRTGVRSGREHRPLEQLNDSAIRRRVCSSPHRPVWSAPLGGASPGQKAFARRARSTGRKSCTSSGKQQ